MTIIVRILLVILGIVVSVLILGGIAFNAFRSDNVSVVPVTQPVTVP